MAVGVLDGTFWNSADSICRPVASVGVAVPVPDAYL